MFAGLRHGAVVGRDDEQDEIDPGDTAQHVADEFLVARHVDEANRFRPLQRQIGKTEIDRQVALFFLGETVSVASR